MPVGMWVMRTAVAFFLYVLSASAGGFIHVNADVFRGNPDFIVFSDFRQNFDQGKRSVAAVGGIKWREPHQTMNAFLGAQVADRHKRR